MTLTQHKLRRVGHAAVPARTAALPEPGRFFAADVGHPRACSFRPANVGVPQPVARWNRPDSEGYPGSALGAPGFPGGGRCVPGQSLESGRVRGPSRGGHRLGPMATPDRRGLKEARR
jgi:hypothetical protein